MTTITIRHVPDGVRNELASRAARSGRSLQEYMLAELTRLSSQPTIDELIERARRRKVHSDVRVAPSDLLADRDADRR